MPAALNNKVARFKTNMQKSIAFLYPRHNQLENVIFIKGGTFLYDGWNLFSSGSGKKCVCVNVHERENSPILRTGIEFK